MPLTVQVYTPGTDGAAWDAFVAHHPDRTPYHERAWGTVVTRAFGFTDRSLVVRDGDSIVGVLPLWETGRKLTNAPWRDRAAPLAAGPDALEALRRAVAGTGRPAILKDWPADQVPPGFQAHPYWVTSVLDLTPGAESVWRVANKRVGRNVRKAERSGVAVERGSTPGHLHRFRRLFRDKRRRLGVPCYPRRFFDALAALESPGLEVFLATVDGRDAAGVVVLANDALAIYAYGAADDALAHTRAMDLAMWRAIARSLALGRARFDFGADSPTQESLLRFKAKWGAFQRTLPTAATPDMPPPEAGDFAAPRYARHRAVLRRCPALLLEALGHVLTRRDG